MKENQQIPNENQAKRKYMNTPNGYVIINETRISRHKNDSILSFIKTPKHYVLVSLIFLLLLAQISSGAHAGFINTIVAIITASVLDLTVATIQKRKIIVPEGGIITGIIVAVVLSPMNNWMITVLTTAIAILSKHLFRVNKKPIFNPAAFGLFVVGIIMASPQSWWGGMSLLPWWSILFLLITGYIVTQKVNKFPLVFSFLGFYLIFILLLSIVHIDTIGDLLRVPYINSALFLAFFMLTDPPTSPAKYSDQVKFGILTALCSVIAYFTLGGLTFLLAGLLVANAWKVMKQRKTKKQPHTVSAHS
ncbi:RnfABCDGE type electron transport complex subunit D [Ectobacillus polymachus]|uniref:RnfABCDGE type electron transport complex subunit D n=1 Tax=Ectobacillus polymachus TaxID=1508806 RepID=UPI003A89A2FC